MSRFFDVIKQSFRSSIKLRIITIIGAIVSLLMILASIGILLQWRTMILNQQEENAKSISKAFSIPVIEALIYAEREDVITSDLLETHIQNFMDNVESIEYISIQNTENRIIAHSDLSLYDTQITDTEFLQVSNTNEVITSIFDDQDYGWILEAIQPLQIGDKRWGTATLGFDTSFTRDEINNSFFLLLFFTVTALIVTLLILYYFINRVMSSLRDLVVEVDKIDLDSDQPMALQPRSDEIGFLIEHFQMLKERLSHSKRQLASAQHQIYQAEKLASIGRLASGVAHEVNNPLNGIRFCVYGIQKDPENQKQTYDYLELIDEGLTHIESVVTKLLGYSRQRTKTSEEVDINNELNKVIDLLDYRLNEKNINLDLNVQDNMPKIKADPNLIQELLMNLLLNSLDAVSDEGSISIQTGIQDDSNIFFSILDDGTGIPEQELDKIFEPFYTTKETGKGTGLGLSVTHGIVEAHNGTINVDSKDGDYTNFRITLPLEAKSESINS